jgi:hypothetical protein
MDLSRELGELPRFGGLERVLPLRVHPLGAERPAAEQPDRTTGEKRAMSSHEARGLLHPVEEVGCAADDEGVVLADRTRLINRPQRDLEPASFERLGDPFGDPPGRAMSGCVAPGARPGSAMTCPVSGGSGARPLAK